MLRLLAEAMTDLLDLGLNGTTVKSVLIEYTVIMQMSDLSVIVIESPITIKSDGIASFSPDSDCEEAFDPVRRLVGKSIEHSVAEGPGGLRVGFTDGTCLHVHPDEAYEAWTVSRPDGRLFVCLPGGEIARWNASPHPHS